MPSEHQRTEEFRSDDAGAGSPPDREHPPAHGAAHWLGLALDDARDGGHNVRRTTAPVGIDWITALDRHR